MLGIRSIKISKNKSICKGVVLGRLLRIMLIKIGGFGFERLVKTPEKKLCFDEFCSWIESKFCVSLFLRERKTLLAI